MNIKKNTIKHFISKKVLSVFIRDVWLLNHISVTLVYLFGKWILIVLKIENKIK